MRADLRGFCFASAVLATDVLLGACPTPLPRPGPAFDGSAYWAWGIAQPIVTTFASDARLYSVLGADISLDGRLPANTGDWSFVTWSPSRQQEDQVTVTADGRASQSITTKPAPPGLNGQPVPSAWANSTVIFQATAGHRAAGATIANLAVFNLVSYPQAPNQPIWAIAFDASPNQLVRADGTYVGPQ